MGAGVAENEIRVRSTRKTVHHARGGENTDRKTVMNGNPEVGEASGGQRVLPVVTGEEKRNRVRGEAQGNRKKKRAELRQTAAHG